MNALTPTSLLLHRVTPLYGSLNPADEIGALSRVRQRHLVGGSDRTVPPTLLQGFVSRFPASASVRWHLEPIFDHRCCWDVGWARLLEAATVD